MPMTIRMSWAGGLKFTGKTAFGHTLTTDASKEAGGKSEGYKPSELVLFGVAGCTGIDIVRILTKQQQELTSLDIVVTGHMPDTAPRPFHTVEVKYIVRGKHIDPIKLEQAIQLSENKHCLVSQSLQHEVKVTTAFEIVEEETSGRELNECKMQTQIAYTRVTNKSFDEVVSALEKVTPEHQFRVLHIHDVQSTLAEKGFQRGPLKILEVCNSGFAYNALQQDMEFALFMPCKFTVYRENDKTVVTLGRPTMIAQLLPNSGLVELATKTEETLKQIMEKVL